MLKYIEFVWLGAALFMVVFLATNIEDMKPVSMIASILGVVIASFMFSYRRRQRKLREQAENEEIERLEKEVAEDDGE